MFLKVGRTLRPNIEYLFISGVALRSLTELLHVLENESVPRRRCFLYTKFGGNKKVQFLYKTSVFGFSWSIVDLPDLFNTSLTIIICLV